MPRARRNIACGRRTSSRVLCNDRLRDGREVWPRVLGARCRHQGTESRPGWPQKLRPPSQTSDTLMWQDCLGESRKIRPSRVFSIIEQLAPLQANLMAKQTHEGE